MDFFFILNEFIDCYNLYEFLNFYFFEKKLRL